VTSSALLRADRDDKVFELRAARRAESRRRRSRGWRCGDVEQHEVARMWSAWKTPSRKNHLEVDLGRAAYERIDVPAVASRLARSASGRPTMWLMVRARVDEHSGYGAGMTTSGSSRSSREALEVRQFLAHVDGAAIILSNSRHELVGVLRQLGVLALEILREGAHELEILVTRCWTPSCKHLDHDVGAVVQRRRVNLRHGARTQSFGIERGERLVERTAECFPHDAECHIRRIGRHRGLELFELGGDVARPRRGAG